MTNYYRLLGFVMPLAGMWDFRPGRRSEWRRFYFGDDRRIARAPRRRRA